MIRGSIGFVTFDDDGTLNRFCVLAANTERFGVDIAPGIFHTFIALADDTVLFEVKPGPYVKSVDKDFASWAPKEGTAEARGYLEKLYRMSEEKRRLGSS